MMLGKIRIPAVIGALLLTVSITACSGDSGNSENKENPPESNTSGTGGTEIMRVDTKEHWQLVPMVTKEMKASGIFGGEGGQWELSVVCDPAEGSLLFSGTDVGGIFRSVDGGRMWEPANVGFYARGCANFAMDPNNINRVIAVGANSGFHISNGLYLSTDKGSTWKQVFPASICGYRDFRDQVAFDKSSYDEKLGGSKTAYWSRAGKLEPENVWGTGDIHPALYKSMDGGETWKEINPDFGDSIVKVHPEKGYVYIANADGFFKSRDGGESFEKKLDGPVKGLDVVNSQGDSVFINTEDGVYVSADSGETFKKTEGSGFPAGPANNPANLKVSPADVNRMVVCKMSNDYNNRTFYSTDGGATWSGSNMDTSKNFLPYNNRQMVYAWHPREAGTLWSLGGDWVTKSTDSGATFAWDQNGNTGIMTGGLFNFCTQNPDVIYFASQDYNGCLTTDRGETWEYINLAQLDWGGFCYGGYAAGEKVVFAGAAEGWDGPRHLKISFDGGKTVTDTGVVYGGMDAAYGDPADAGVLFASNYRSTDGGHTWSEMKGCKGVITHNPSGSKELYGIDGKNIVMSVDHGANWTGIAALPENIRDIGYDHENKRIFAATGSGLYAIESSGAIKILTTKIPVNQYGERKLDTVAVDPQDTRVIYAGGSGNVYLNDAAIVRSRDGGNTWEVLTRNTRNSNVAWGTDTGREPSCIRVHPVTRQLFVSGSCFGWAKFSPPEK